MKLNETTSQSCRMSLAMCLDHTVLPSMHPDTSKHTPPSPQPEAGTRFTYPGGMEG